MRAAPKTVLIYVGLDLVGDGLMKLPFVRAARAAFPDAHITWLAGKGRTVYASSLAPLVKGLIDEVIEDAGIGTNWSELLTRPLPGRRFDVIIDTQRRVLTSLILRRIRHGAFISSCANYLLSSAKPPSGIQKPPLMVHQMLQLLEAATGKPPQLNAQLGIDPDVEADAARRLPQGRSYVGLAPGAGGKHKCWPLDRYIALGQKQAELGRTPVVFLGPDEQDWTDALRQALPTAIFPLEKTSSPLLTIALARRCSAVVANDAGPGHMMAAEEVPMVSLWGPTDPSKATPITPYLILIHAMEFGGAAMTDIPYAAVETAVEKALLMKAAPAGV